MGIDIHHFTYPGYKADRALLGADQKLFGHHSLAQACEVVDYFGGMGPGTGPRGKDPVLRARIRAFRKDRGWASHYLALNAAFLAHDRQRSIFSPFSGEDVPILGSIPLGPYQVTLLMDRGRLLVFIGIGHMPVGLYQPDENLFVILTKYTLNMRGVLGNVLAHMLSHADLWLAWIRRAQAGPLPRAYVIGDNRPGHFIKQSLAYLDAHEAEILAFSAGGGLLVSVPDWCAMDPFTLIPSLAPLPRLQVPSDRLTETMLLEGYDAHRVYRFTTHRDPAWLRRRFAALETPAARSSAASPDLLSGGGRRFRVMISIDAERQRILNQEEAFRFVLQRLGDVCAAEGRALDIVWDGWTVPDVPSKRDLEVMARIEAMVARITSDLALPPGQRIDIFGRSAQAKVPVVAECDLVFVTQGTGAVIPCWLLKRPTIVYHVASMVHDRSCLDDEAVFSVDQRAVGEPPSDDPLAVQHRRFTLAPWGLEEAMGRALSSSVAITRLAAFQPVAVRPHGLADAGSGAAGPAPAP